MLKRFWNYQVLLKFSHVYNAKKPSKIPFYISIIYMLVVITLAVILREAAIIFIPLVFILFPIYSIINSQNKLFETVPVSKLYSLINVYLYILVWNLFYIAGFVPILLLFKIMSLFARSSNYADLIINFSVNNWKAIVITGFIYTIIVNILLPVFFISLNFLRKALTISVVALIIIALRLYKNTLPVVTEIGEISIIKSINIMPHCNEILLILACVSVVLIPISIFISYRIYREKRCLVC